jgi:hypothetical protein
MPVHDRGTGVEQQGPAEGEPAERGVQDGQRQPRTQRPAPVPVGPLRRIDDVGRVGDHQVERAAVEAGQQVAPARHRVAGAGQGGVEAGEAEGGPVDVAHQHGGVGPRLGDHDPARPGAAADVGGPAEGGGAGFEVLLHGGGEAVGVGAEEHRVGSAVG